MGSRYRWFMLGAWLCIIAMLVGLLLGASTLVEVVGVVALALILGALLSVSP